jgi:hypothetical protein
MFLYSVNPVRKDGALTPTLSEINIIYFYHPAINGGAF